MSRFHRFLFICLVTAASGCFFANRVPASTGSFTFKPALPGYVFRFPRDHRAHEAFRTEWWYYNGHLNGPKGERFGYQLTFFRVGLWPGPPPSGTSRWRLGQVYLAHLAVSDIEGRRFYYREKASRGALGLAGSDDRRYRIWVETWSAEETGRRHRLEALEGDLGLSLMLDPLRPPVIHGLNGVSQKGPKPGQASHYYSLTRMATEGYIFLQGKRIPVRGQSWMDHEFGSNQLDPAQIGWDWFSLQLDNGTDVMIYRLRHKDGPDFFLTAGTLIGPDGEKRHLSGREIILSPTATWKSPRSGAVYPVSWEVRLPEWDLRLRITPFFRDQELLTEKSTGVTYWEGAVEGEGFWKELKVRCKGYLEMTGYDRPFRPKI